MTMRISPPLRGVIVALPTAAWLAQSDATLGGTLALAAGAAFVTFAWIMYTPPRPTAHPAAQPAERECSEHRHGSGERRIARVPSGRGARDVRCPASRATARARRSTRR